MVEFPLLPVIVGAVHVKFPPISSTSKSLSVNITLLGLGIKTVVVVVVVFVVVVVVVFVEFDAASTKATNPAPSETARTAR
jgi:hypothetical protein